MTGVTCLGHQLGFFFVEAKTLPFASKISNMKQWVARPWESEPGDRSMPPWTWTWTWPPCNPRHGRVGHGRRDETWSIFVVGFVDGECCWCYFLQVFFPSGAGTSTCFLADGTLRVSCDQLCAQVSKYQDLLSIKHVSNIQDSSYQSRYWSHYWLQCWSCQDVPPGTVQRNWWWHEFNVWKLNRLSFWRENKRNLQPGDLNGRLRNQKQQLFILECIMNMLNMLNILNSVENISENLVAV